MPFIYSDYSGNSDEALLPLVVSERTQQLILAALKTMDSRYAWVGNFDDIDADLALAYEQVSNIVTSPDKTPLGSIVMFTSDTIPDKWLWCNGQSLDEDDYPDLFALIGHTFGSAGAGFFNLPQTGFRFVLGIDDFSELGDFGGEINHTLTTAEIPSHNHVQQSRGGAAGAILTTSGYLANAATPVSTTTTSTANSGGGGSHNNMPPYRRLAYIIKALP